MKRMGRRNRPLAKNRLRVTDRAGELGKSSVRRNRFLPLLLSPSIDLRWLISVVPFPGSGRISTYRPIRGLTSR
ncbi:hypothetical protein GW17_00042749 [Ensete ventricosum]|nr:hypothetical protein GW17_00042749 [Ensete ventricosum]RZS19168.1 hypothetical protein BHM03_00051515 [Ensete ventricosum]